MNCSFIRCAPNLNVCVSAQNCTGFRVIACIKYLCLASTLCSLLIWHEKQSDLTRKIQHSLFFFLLSFLFFIWVTSLVSAEWSAVKHMFEAVCIFCFRFLCCPFYPSWVYLSMCTSWFSSAETRGSVSPSGWP